MNWVLVIVGVALLIGFGLVFATLIVDGYYLYAQSSVNFLNFYSTEPIILVVLSAISFFLFFLAVVERVCCNTCIKKKRCVYLFGLLLILITGSLIVIAVFHIKFAITLSNCQELFQENEGHLDEKSLDFLSYMMAGKSPAEKVDFINTLYIPLCEKPHSTSIILAVIIIVTLVVGIISPCCISSETV